VPPKKPGAQATGHRVEPDPVHHRDPNWDSHEDLVRDHGYLGPILDGGAAALLDDLKAHGTSDELGFKAAEHPAYCYDLHATALHLLGIDHEKLSVYNNGIKRRLTDVHGHVIEPIIA